MTLLLGASVQLQAQINSNPGSYNWTQTTAWAGGVVPIATDVVNITSNSTINLDVAVSQTADVNVLAGGVLSSLVPVNELTVTGADINVTGQLNFNGLDPVPVTIDEGHLTNTGVFTSGDFDLTNTSGTGQSLNSGDLMVQGDVHIMGTEIFENDLGMNVSGLTTVDVDCELLNNDFASLGSVVNDGNFENLGTTSLTDTLWNNADLTSDGMYMDISESIINDGDITLLDSMNVDGDLINSGIFYNDSSVIHIGNDFWNDGTITGDQGGYYQISQASENDAVGIINGNIDLCDTTLTGQYLDIMAGTVDYNTVTFCSILYASIENPVGDEVNVYPNPAVDQISIDGLISGNYTIVGTDGRVVQSGLVDENIDISLINSGIYIITISSDDQNFKSTFVKR